MENNLDQMFSTRREHRKCTECTHFTVGLIHPSTAGPCSCKCKLDYFWPISKHLEYVQFLIKSVLALLGLSGIPHEDLWWIKALELLMKSNGSAAAACAHREFSV